MAASAVKIAVGACRQFSFPLATWEEIVAGQTLAGTPSVTPDDASLATVGIPTVSGTSVLCFFTGLVPGQCDLWVWCATNVSPTRVGGKTVLIVE